VPRRRFPALFKGGRRGMGVSLAQFFLGLSLRTHLSFVLSQKRQFFAKIFRENI
jgi:hypothetical protein